MKYVIFKISITILLLFLMGPSCKKDKKDDLKCHTEAVNGPEDDITGKWKQVKGETVFRESKIVDYSCNNIIFHFKPDGILTIWSDLVDSLGYSSSSSTYEFSLHKSYAGLKEKYTLKIDQLIWACGISGSQMTLNMSDLDGPILYFVRVQ